MKRRYIIFLSLSVSLLANAQAQIQSGQVKTRGRMANHKHIQGQGLSGAVVTLKCNNIVKDGPPTGTNGAFSIAVPAKTFNVSVSKDGYELVDADAIGKSYQYSKNPIYLVMETPEQCQEDKLAAEHKIRRTLQKQLLEREDEIEALKEQGKITEERYRDELQKLYTDQKNNETLIAEMAYESFFVVII